MVLQYDAYGVVTYVSPSARRFGYDPPDVVGKSIGDFLTPGSWESISKNLASYRAGGPFPEGALTNATAKTADGREVCLEGAQSAVYDDRGKFAGVISVQRDITERRKLEQTLSESEAKFRQLAEASSDVIVRYDSSGINYVSPSIREFGYDPVTIVGADPLALIHPDDRERMGALMRRVMETGDTYPADDHTFRAIDAHGEVVWLESRPVVIRDDTGGSLAVLTQLRDITERKAAAIALKESEVRFRQLADSANDLILHADAQGRVMFASPALQRLLGRSSTDAVGRRASEVLQPEKPEEFLETAMRLAANPEAAEWREPWTLRYRHADGHLVWLESSHSPLLDDEGRFAGALIAARDVTARVALESELRAKQADAEVAAVAKAEFLANMSHELRTPLTAVAGFSEQLAKLMERTPETSPKARRYVDLIETAAQTMVTMVDDVLTLSRLEAGLVEIHPRPFDPADCVAESIGIVSLQAGRKNLAIEARISTQLPAAVKADPVRVRQVLLNLLSNAIKFTEAGAVTVTTSHDSKRLRIAVMDTGIGFNAESGERLFRRFTQVDGSITRRYGGTGLGLAICKDLVDLMGGEIGVNSAPGEGSTFWFEVPAPHVAAAPPETETPAPLARRADAKILVADDDPQNRELIGLMLGDAGYQAVFAEDGEEAVREAERTKVDAILMDIQMPALDGMTAARRILGRPGPNQQTPILALSANVLPEHAEACRRAGMRVHIAKPIDRTLLLTTMARLIEESA
jgi:PAS domain S-box-containing protein